MMTEAGDARAHSSPIRVALVEDQPLYRGMLADTIAARAGFEVVAVASSVQQARRLIGPGSVDVVVLDVELPDGNGVGLGVQLRRADPELGVLLLSGQDVMELLLDLPADVRAGWGYLSKNSPLSSAETLVEGIVAASEGRTVLDPTLVAGATPRAGSAVARLSPRQYEVLQLVAQGLSNAGAGERLGISPRSVENHLNAIYSALDLPTDRNPRVSAVLRLIEDTSRG